MEKSLRTRKDEASFGKRSSIASSLQHSQRLSSNFQERSPFFSKLPLDVRLDVYRALFGEQNVLVRLDWVDVDADGSEGTKSCSSADMGVDHACGSKSWIQWHCISPHRRYERWPRFWIEIQRYSHPNYPAPDKICLAFLLTCRQVYMESVDIIYKTNNFQVLKHLTLEYLSKSMPPLRFQSLSSLELFWGFWYDPQPSDSDKAKMDYDSRWDLVASIKGLRKLRVSIDAAECAQEPSMKLNDAWLSPLTNFSHLQLVELTMPSSYILRFQQIQDEFPCRFARLGDNERGEICDSM